jgi:hypothetical protein
MLHRSDLVVQELFYQEALNVTFLSVVSASAVNETLCDSPDGADGPIHLQWKVILLQQNPTTE